MSAVTERARKARVMATQEAQRMNSDFVCPEHLLLGLVEEGSGVAWNVLKNLGVDLAKARCSVDKFVKVCPEMVMMGRLPLSEEAKQVETFACQEVEELRHNYLGTEHLLLGLTRFAVNNPSAVISQVFAELNVNLGELRLEILRLVAPQVLEAESEKVGLSEPKLQCESFVIRDPLISQEFSDQMEAFMTGEKKEIVHTVVTILYRELL